MPCMCGDTQCPSCGPAQGNWRCPICGAWADDGCEHIDEETGELKAEYQAAATAQYDAELEAFAEMMASIEDDARIAREWSKYDSVGDR